MKRCCERNDLTEEEVMEQQKLYAEHRNFVEIRREVRKKTDEDGEKMFKEFLGMDLEDDSISIKEHKQNLKEKNALLSNIKVQLRMVKEYQRSEKKKIKEEKKRLKQKKIDETGRLPI